MRPAIAFFVSCHGFGHATRTAAVIEALRRLRPEIRPELFTRVPRWLFEDSLSDRFGWHPVRADVGMVQRSSVEEDAAATAEELQQFYPFAEARLAALAVRLRALGCRLVVADISPLALAVARMAGLPSVLVESFTWDWIYASYLDEEPRLARYAEAFAELYAGATRHVQTEPVGRPAAGAVRVAPVRRRPRGDRRAARAALGLGDERPMALLTMGGVTWRHHRPDHLQARPEIDFVLFGEVDELERRGNVTVLPERSPVFVPDLIAAADAVVGKLGYGTVAEAVGAGTPFLFVERPRFAEGPVLAEFLRSRLPAAALSREEFDGGAWLERLDELLEQPRPSPDPRNGDEAVAAEIVSLLG